MMLFNLYDLDYLYTTLRDNLYANMLSQSMIKLKKPGILIWNLSLITFTSGSQKRNLNKSLPFFLNNYHLISMLRVRDSNHVLYKHDTNHQGAATNSASFLNHHVSVPSLPLFHLVHISAQILLLSLPNLAYLPQPHCHHSRFSFYTCLHSSYHYQSYTMYLPICLEVVRM